MAAGGAKKISRVMEPAGQLPVAGGRERFRVHAPGPPLPPRPPHRRVPAAGGHRWLPARRPARAEARSRRPDPHADSHVLEPRMVPRTPARRGRNGPAAARRRRGARGGAARPGCAGSGGSRRRRRGPAPDRPSERLPGGRLLGIRASQRRADAAADCVVQPAAAGRGALGCLAAGGGRSPAAPGFCLCRVPARVRGAAARLRAAPQEQRGRRTGRRGGQPGHARGIGPAASGPCTHHARRLRQEGPGAAGGDRRRHEHVARRQPFRRRDDAALAAGAKAASCGRGAACRWNAVSRCPPRAVTRRCVSTTSFTTRETEACAC